MYSINFSPEKIYREILPKHLDFLSLPIPGRDLNVQPQKLQEEARKTVAQVKLIKAAGNANNLPILVQSLLKLNDLLNNYSTNQITNVDLAKPLRDFV